MKILAAIAFTLALGLSPSFAQTASGGASGAGADQGGTGAPGSGTGVPGATTEGQTGTGVGTSATAKQQPTVPATGTAPAN